jgi:putative hydrolase of the HAD superfamily
MRLSEFDAITFDVYGTLIDWEPSIIEFFARWSRRHSLAASGLDLLIVFDRVRSEVQKERPAYLYPEVLRRCFDRVSYEFGIPSEQEEREQFSRSPHHWPAYPDSHAALLALQRHAKIGALTNIDDASLASSCQSLDYRFDLVVTAEQVGAYKPDWPHFNTALEELAALGIQKSRILQVGQSLRADVAPANKLGLRCAWVHRPGRILGLSGEGAAEAKPDLTVSNLTELVQTLTQS